jgi:hypothetical protein
MIPSLDLHLAPNAVLYRGMAVLGSYGFGALPKHCAEFMAGFFALAIVFNWLRVILPPHIGRFIPIPMAMVSASPLMNPDATEKES